MTNWLKMQAVWFAVLVALVLLLTFVPTTNAIPDWFWIAFLFAMIVIFALMKYRKRMGS